MSAPIKFHLTQSLLSAWLWSLKLDDGHERFVRALNRQKDPPTPEMLNGIAFENALNQYLNGVPLDQLSDPVRNWIPGIKKTAEYLWGARQQVTVYRDILVDGVCFRLMGVFDFLKEGVIYDTKFSQHYTVNKYYSSPQHPAYLYLCSQAREFRYLSCDGTDVFVETYRREDVRPVEYIIRDFMHYLGQTGLVETYASKWELNNYFKQKNLNNA